MKNQKSLFAMCCIVATLVAGCGSSSQPAGMTNGVFADALVVGASFACGTQNGVTGAGGTLACPAKSTVTISVGGITLCTQPVQPFMTPLSCAQASDPTATSTPSVVAMTQFLMSINTTPVPSQSSPSTITITSSELQAAKNLTLNFSTATQAELLAAVVTTTGNAGATLVTQAAAQTEITSTVLGSLAGKKFAGTYSGASSGTWSVTIASDGSVSGTASSNNGSVPVSGHLVSGTTYSGTSGSATWTGNLDTSKAPAVFSGTWSDNGATGTFTGTQQ